MSEFLSANWMYIVGAVAVLLLVLLWLLLARRGRNAVPTVQAESKSASLLGEDGEPVVRVRVETAAPTLKNAPLSVTAPLADPVRPSPPQPASVAELAAPVAEDALSSGGGDNLRLLKGVGPKLADLLATLGVTSFEQIAAWNSDDIARIDSQLGNFRGRVTRDNWVDQAGYLARRDKAGFEAKYGALEGEL